MLHNNYTQEQYKSSHVILPATNQKGSLLLGDLNAATDEQLIKEHNIRTIVTAASGLDHLQISPEVTHIVFPLMDLKTENIQTYFQLSFNTIEQNLKKGAVLVHCGAGISRSATLVIAYYMKKYGSVFNHALKFVKRIRPSICPNLGFELQLKKYQQKVSSNSEKPAQGIQNTPIKKESSSSFSSEPRQMLFNFSIARQPSVKSKQQKVANSNPKKPGYQTTNRFNNNSHKKHDLHPGDLFICGKQTGVDLKNESMFENGGHGGHKMGQSWMGNPNKQRKKEVGGFKF